MALIYSFSHLMTSETTSAKVQAEIDFLQTQITRLTELRDRYAKEEKAGTRKT